MSQLQLVRTTGAIPADARTTLASFGLRPWSTHAIRAYMATEKARYRPNIWYYVDKVFNTTVVLWALVIVGALCAVSALVFFFTGFAALVTFKFAVPLWSAGAFVSTLIVCALLAQLYEAMRLGRFVGIKVLEPAKWMRYDIGKCRNLLTEQANRAMGRARALYPTASFFVDDLQQNERSLDPVLWVHIRGEEPIAILVWGPGGVIQPDC